MSSYELKTHPVFWQFVLPAQIMLAPIKKISSTNQSYLSDCGTSIMWFEPFFNVHTYPSPKPTRPHLPLKQDKYIIGSTIW